MRQFQNFFDSDPFPLRNFFHCQLHSPFQPMDQNVIESLKSNYRRILLREMITKMEHNERFRPNLLQALRYLKTAWNNVKQATIRNAFKAAQFILEDEVSFTFIFTRFQTFFEDVPGEDRDDQELLDLWQNLNLMDQSNQEIDMQDYMNVDEEVATDATNLAEMSTSAMEVEESDSDEEL